MPRKSSAKSSYQVTSAGVNPTEDRAHRMRMYFIAMTLRLACVLSLFWVHGWWVIIPAVGAVALPWFAVMVGNAVAYGGEEQVAAVEPLEVTAAEATASDEGAASEPELLVVDVDPVRRSAGGTPEAGPAAGNTPYPAHSPNSPTPPTTPSDEDVS